MARQLLSIITSALLFFVSCHSSLLFHPTKIEYSNPKMMGFQYHEEQVQSKDGTVLNLWRIPVQKNQKVKGRILQFHGNGENLSSHYTSLLWLVNEGYELVSFDYRGYGKSQGVPEAEGIYEDTAVVLNREIAKSKKDDLPLIVYGQSMGGHLALRSVADLEDESTISLIVIDGSFLSAQDIVARYGDAMCFFPAGWLLSHILVTDSYSAKDRLDRIQTNTLIIHGTEDPTVPYEFGESLYKQFRQQSAASADFKKIEGAGHVNWMKSGHSQEAKWFLDYLNRSVLP